MNEVFDEGRLLEVGFALNEGQKRSGSANVELGRVGNGEAEIFVQEGSIGFNPRLELLIAVVKRDRVLKVAFTEVVFLGRDDRCRQRVGVEIVGVVSNHSDHAGEQVRREGVLIACGADRLEVIAVLDLSRLLLKQFIGNLKARQLMTDAQVEAVPRRKVTLISNGEVCR